MNRRNHSRRSRDRGVSEAIGFVFSFSLLVLSVGLLFTAGFDTVSTTQTGEQLQNAERTFEVLERNFDDIQRREAPARSADMNLNGGTVRVRNGSAIVINVTGGASFNRSIPVRALSYELDRTEIEFENGVVFRRGRTGSSIMLTQPRLECTADTAIVTVVSIRSDSGSLTGDTVATITAERAAARLLMPKNRPPQAVTRVNVSFDSPNEAGWRRYLNHSDSGWTDPEGDGTYECTNVDRVYVRQTILEVAIRG